jgi:tetratricopeptide (TPR) repeat protein
LKAIEQEEKGERYGDGKKARKFYENACELYENAYNKEKQDFICLYNWARVTYILATFSKPAYSSQKKINLLQLAIERFRSSLKLNPKALDAMFNLKQSLSSLGEMCLDEVSKQAALPFFKEACELGDQVYEIQEGIYKRLNSENENDEGNEYHRHIQEDSTATAVNKDEYIFDEENIITINSLIETLTTNAEDLNSFSSIVDDTIESERLFNQALEKLKRAEEITKEAESNASKNENKDDNNSKGKEEEKEEEEEEEIDFNSIDSAYASILSSRGEHLFNTLGIFDALFFENALEHQNKVIQRIPESSNSQIVYQQKAQELCNKADVLCSFAETLISNGESIDEHSPSQEMYREALLTYEKALTFEDSNNSIICKIGDIKLTLAQNYLLLSKNKEDDAYQSMLQLIHQGLEIYKRALKNSTEQPIEPEIYLRIAKGLSYYNDQTKQCQEMFQKFVHMGGNLEIIEDDHHFVNFDFCDNIKNEPWFIQEMKQLE